MTPSMLDDVASEEQNEIKKFLDSKFDYDKL